MKIAIASDHGGYALKNELLPYITELGHEFRDFGCYSTDSMDYPDIAFPAAEAVASGEFDRGILICGHRHRCFYLRKQGSRYSLRTLRRCSFRGTDPSA